MKFFLDTANLDELKKGAALGIVDGVTTNPSLIAKEGNAIEDQIRQICEVVNGPVSAEVVATKTDEMVEEGRRLAKIHPNVVVKVPLTRDGIRACSLLSKEGIRVNVTLCFSSAQALLAAKAEHTSSARLSDALTTSDGMARNSSTTSSTSTTITATPPRCSRHRSGHRRM